jgi:hypothetical protein
VETKAASCVFGACEALHQKCRPLSVISLSEKQNGNGDHLPEALENNRKDFWRGDHCSVIAMLK